MEHPVYRRRAARHRACERQAGHLAVPRVGSHAVRRAVLHLHHPARGAAEWPHGELNVWLGMANTFILIGSSVTMVMAWASLKLNDLGKHRLYLILTFVLAGVFLVNKYFEYADHFARGEGPVAQHVSGHLLHADRTARAAHHRRDGRDGVFPGPGREAVEDEP